MKALLLVVSAMIVIGTSAEENDIGPSLGLEGNISLMNKQSRNLNLEDFSDILSRSITRKERISHSDFVFFFLKLVDFCEQQPDIALTSLKEHLTEKTAPLFLYRLLSIAENRLVEIEALFNVIVKVKSVAELTTGWVTVLVECTWQFETKKALRAMGHRLVSKWEVEEVDPNRFIKDIPEAFLEHIHNIVLNIVLDHDDDGAVDLTLTGRIPAPFALIPEMYFEEVGEAISMKHSEFIISQPTLARNLFFLGVPIHLHQFTIAKFKDFELANLLPFAQSVVTALSAQIQDLIDSGHSDLVATILSSEAFFSSEFFESDYDFYDNLKNIISVLINQGQHKLLRLLMESALPDNWVVTLEDEYDISFLQQEVEADNRDAVDVPLSFTHPITPTDSIEAAAPNAKEVAKKRSFGPPLPPDAFNHLIRPTDSIEAAAPNAKEVAMKRSFGGSRPLPPKKRHRSF